MKGEIKNKDLNVGFSEALNVTWEQKSHVKSCWFIHQSFLPKVTQQTSEILGGPLCTCSFMLIFFFFFNLSFILQTVSQCPCVAALFLFREIPVYFRFLHNLVAIHRKHITGHRLHTPDLAFTPAHRLLK